jgi:hypothetical protein
MRITESKIRQILREEARRVLREMERPVGDPSDPSYRSAMRQYYRSLEEPEMRKDRDPAPMRRFPGSYDDDGSEDEDDRALRVMLGPEHDDLDEGAFPEMGGSPRAKLESYLMDNGGEELVDAVMSAVDSALKRAMDKGDEAPASEDVTFNLSDETLDMIPEDDQDEWHEMLDAVLEDEFEADDGDYESTRETERDLSHPSNFIPSRRSNR